MRTSVRRPWECTTVVHRGLYEEQILARTTVGLIDLDDTHLGPPDLDLERLDQCEHLTLIRLGCIHGLTVDASAIQR